MARYLCSFTVVVPFDEVNAAPAVARQENVDRLRQLLMEVLQACSLDIIYDKSDYVMAREIPGEVPFTKLVTVEVLIDKSVVTETEARMNFVVKNEELPLQVDNHCHQMFDLVYQAITNNHHWQLVESVAG